MIRQLNSAIHVCDKIIVTRVAWSNIGKPRFTKVGYNNSILPGVGLETGIFPTIDERANHCLEARLPLLAEVLGSRPG